MTEYEMNIARAIALIEQNGGNADAAYKQASQQGDNISSAQWDEAEARFAKNA